MDKPLLYDCYCGGGGASRGYMDAGFRVVGIDNRKQPHYCGDEFIQMDVFDFFHAVQRGDFLKPIAWHASPPCQAHTCLKAMWNAKKHEDLIPMTRKMLRASELPYIIENVPGAPLLAGWNSIILCGTMFGLKTKDGSGELRRHRLFECSFYPGLTPPCNHGGPTIGVYGGHGRDRRRTVTVTGHCGGYSRRDGVQSFSVEQRREAMGISWMSGGELSQAIPPKYTEFLGNRLMQFLETTK